ncbi:hypothetical protein JCM19239_7266 [Vibrio variabilis]|uniref:Uncharacterized protein n=1 Tax=Vibrio variabilis TaxID=990271 RepID=A0ABQ0J7H0_9VIBR|nr:hypothetical protein JCM19239_7266 [Vibrio variabilis]
MICLDTVPGWSANSFAASLKLGDLATSTKITKSFSFKLVSTFH